MKFIMSIKATQLTEKGRNGIIRVERETNFPSLFLLLWCAQKDQQGTVMQHFQATFVRLFQMFSQLKEARSAARPLPAGFDLAVRKQDEKIMFKRSDLFIKGL